MARKSGRSGGQGQRKGGRSRGRPGHRRGGRSRGVREHGRDDDLRTRTRGNAHGNGVWRTAFERTALDLARSLRRGSSRRRVALVATFLVAIIVAVGRTLNPTDDGPPPSEISGQARLVDGDSLWIGHHEVRLVGIDAPEGRQTCSRDGRNWACGRAAREALAARIGGRPLTCRTQRRDQHGRVLAVCAVNGQELNRWMVSEGWAVAFGRPYRRQEREARAARKGLWSSAFERPSDWRARQGRL